MNKGSYVRCWVDAHITIQFRMTPHSKKGQKQKVFCQQSEPHLGSASVPIIPISLNQEDFGRDKDLKTLLKTLQPKNFSRKEDNVFGTLEEWIIEMEDHFTLASYNLVAQGIMDRAKLTRLAELW